MLTASTDGTQRVWNSESGEILSVFREGAGGFRPISMSPDGSKFAVSGSVGNVGLVRTLSNGASIQTLKGHSGPILAIAYSPDGSRIVTGSADHSARLWDAGSGTQLFDFEGHTAGVTHVEFSRDGLELLTFSEDGEIRVWNTLIGKMIFSCLNAKPPQERLRSTPGGSPAIVRTGNSSLVKCRAHRLASTCGG